MASPETNVHDFSIPIYIDERNGLPRTGEAVRIGVPLCRGCVREAVDVVVTDEHGTAVPHQARVLARWSDRSIKWLLVDAVTPVSSLARTTLFVGPRSSARMDDPASPPELRVAKRSGGVSVDTGCAQFEILEGHAGPLASVVIGKTCVLGPSGSALRLRGVDGTTYSAVVDRLDIEELGPLRAAVVTEGWFRAARRDAPLHFKTRLTFIAGSAAVRLDLQVRNTRPAVHPGGTWDLGDPGSWYFRDLTVTLEPGGAIRALRWYAERQSDEREQAEAPWIVYQDSSGGENWNSLNHVDHQMAATVSFRGYRVSGGAGAQEHLLAEGHRAMPCLTLVSDDTWMAAGTTDFWQNFPKALRWRDGALHIGVFPAETQKPFELQGGEQKRHTVLLDFGKGPLRPLIAELQHPAAVWVDPSWIETTRAITWFTAQSGGDHARYADYVHHIIEGPHAFVSKREIIDEYGWRNFGDLFADHEAVGAADPARFISHYNNQYDFLYGAFVHFERSGDPRWRQLLEDAARHAIDVDIYHTERDKAAFNGGLFWHTDHYLPAVTCTHRTYSRRNGPSGTYGGGPSNEHNYTSGLLHYYYLTGDPDAADAVRDLAEWVIGMDDGARTLYAVADSGPTGGASKTLEAAFHHPGRGAGNSINALIDAYTLSRRHAYLAKAEEIIQRCVHPADDITSLRLDDPEHRWSYLVFFQVLGKYLAMKVETGETDYAFHHARESLLHYAAWIADNEVPYKDVLHKVEIPTETWPAHDVRKSHVLHVAAEYASGPQRDTLRQRADFFFERCLTDLVTFSTAYVTRPLVILCVHGAMHDYFRKYPTAAVECPPHNHDFGSPDAFVPQRARARSALASKVAVLTQELRRIAKDRLYSLRAWTRRTG
jgi:hypothetical protein